MKKKQIENPIILSKRRNKRNKEEEKENTNNNYAYQILIIILFSFLLILSWLSLKWLYEYQFIFTFHRYINLGFSIYFPIQASSFVLYLINLIAIIIITISSNYFIINNIIYIYKKENNQSFYKLPNLVIIPILLNSFLFLLGRIVYAYYSFSHYFYFVGLCLCFISLFSLIKLLFDKKLTNNYFQINFKISFVKVIFEECFFEMLMVLDLYYYFYVICQIIFCFTNNLNIENYLGIIANLFFGIVSIYIIFELKSISFLIYICLIFFGIEYFQFTIRPEEKEEINLSNGEKILSGIFLFCFFLEFIYIILYKYQNKKH